MPERLKINIDYSANDLNNLSEIFSTLDLISLIPTSSSEDFDFSRREISVKCNGSEPRYSVLDVGHSGINKILTTIHLTASSEGGNRLEIDALVQKYKKNGE